MIYPYFLFDFFLEAWAEILTKFSLVFLVDLKASRLKTPDRYLEINWPLEYYIPRYPIDPALICILI